MKRKSVINIEIDLDESNVPKSIHWQSTDNPNGASPQECKAMLLALFDKDHLDTLKIDLWTKEMQILEMDRFFYQSLRAMADTYYKATQNNELASQMQQFVQYFGEQTGIIEKQER
ncbi:MAG: gliding motility protein GldC [Bacteroidota bacterium]